MMTAMQTTCSACGMELPRDAPRGLCPACLFQLDEPTAAGTSANSSAPTAGPALSTRCFGDYELLDEIARGGMGIVYRARQVSLDRFVAVKMILLGSLANAVKGSVNSFDNSRSRPTAVK
jgi:serine/threonine-protein kinase